MELCLSVSPGDLNRAEQKILDYINTNPDSFLFSSIGQLAQRLELQQLYLQKTARNLNITEFDRAVEALTCAKRIFLHGKNASSSLAQMLAFRLRRLGLPVSLLPSAGSELLEGLVQARAQDLVVMFSFSKLSREGRIILDYSKDAGYQTLAFVSRTCIPPQEQADIRLFAYRGEETEYHSMAAPAALLDALVVAVTQRLGRQGAGALEQLHQAKKKYFPTCNVN